MAHTYLGFDIEGAGGWWHIVSPTGEQMPTIYDTEGEAQNAIDNIVLAGGASNAIRLGVYAGDFDLATPAGRASYGEAIAAAARHWGISPR